MVSKYKSGMGRGWHNYDLNQSTRHSMARKTGRAGNAYKNPLKNSIKSADSAFARKFYYKKKAYFADFEGSNSADEDDRLYSIYSGEDPRAYDDEMIRMKKFGEGYAIGLEKERLRQETEGKNKPFTAGQRQVGETVVKPVRPGALLSDDEVYKLAPEEAEAYLSAVREGVMRGNITEKDMAAAGLTMAMPEKAYETREKFKKIMRDAHKPYRTDSEKAAEYQSTIDERKKFVAKLKSGMTFKTGMALADVEAEGFAGAAGFFAGEDEGLLNPVPGSKNVLFDESLGSKNPLFSESFPDVPAVFEMNSADVKDIWNARKELTKNNVDAKFEVGVGAYKQGDIPALMNAITDLEVEKQNLKDRYVFVDQQARSHIMDSGHRNEMISAEYEGDRGSNPIFAGGSIFAALGGKKSPIKTQMEEVEKLNAVLADITKESNKVDARLSNLRFKEKKLRLSAEVKPEPVPGKIKYDYGEEGAENGEKVQLYGKYGLKDFVQANPVKLQMVSKQDVIALRKK